MYMFVQYKISLLTCNTLNFIQGERDVQKVKHNLYGVLPYIIGTTYNYIMLTTLFIPSLHQAVPLLESNRQLRRELKDKQSLLKELSIGEAKEQK